MVKLIETTGRFNVTIPKDIIKKKRWKKGQELFVTLNKEGNVEIMELKNG